MKVIIALFVLIASYQGAFAAGESGYVKIVSTASASNLGNHIHVKVSTTPTMRPACATHTTWHFTLPLDTAWGKNLYAMLLAAKATGTTVWLSGTGACSQESDIETLGQ